MFWVLGFLACAPSALAGDAPAWMHALVNTPLPAHDEKTDAVLLYSETNVSVASVSKTKTVIRQAYKVLRPEGRRRGTVVAFLNSNRKISNLRGWCIPAQGKDYEVKDKEGVELSPPMIEGAELVEDVKAKILEIPAPDPGNIVGYEYEIEEHPLVLQDIWRLQNDVPVRESRYSLEIPPGWEFKAQWLNYPETQPKQQSSNGAQWVVSDLKGIRAEEDMPPMRGLAGQMVVSFYPPGGAALNGFSNWQQMGDWYRNLTTNRRDASEKIKQEVATLTASAPTQLDKMKALAKFVQHDIRYVAIELGIGGFQPHPAADVFTHRYGDCKDKATLMSSMLHEVGIDSYYVVINTERGSITSQTPAQIGFNHVVMAIKLPEGVTDSSLVATMQHPRMGKLLFFDPTNEFTPFGQIGGYLQANYGLLVTADGGELVELPKLAATTNGIQRTAKLTLDTTGRLQGEVQEIRLGDRARSERYALQTAKKDTDRIKPFENLLSGSLSNFHITKASMVNLQQTDRPFGLNYSFESDDYAKGTGDLLLVRPRVLGSKGKRNWRSKNHASSPSNSRAQREIRTYLKSLSRQAMKWMNCLHRSMPTSASLAITPRLKSKVR